MRLQKRQVISKESYKRQYCRTMIIYERHCISKSDYQRRWSSLVLLAVTASRVPGHAQVTPPAQPPQARSCTFLAFSPAPIGGVAPPPLQLELAPAYTSTHKFKIHKVTSRRLSKFVLMWVQSPTATATLSLSACVWLYLPSCGT